MVFHGIPHTDVDHWSEVVLKADGVGTLEALEKIVQEFGERTNDINLNVVASVNLGRLILYHSDAI